MASFLWFIWHMESMFLFPKYWDSATQRRALRLYARQRSLQVIMWRDAGLTYEQIGKRLNVNPGRVTTIAYEGCLHRFGARGRANRAKAEYLAWLRKSTIAVAAPTDLPD